MGWDKPVDRLLGLLEETASKDRRKVLPQKDVVIGTHCEGDLAVELRAEIVLGETTPPDPDIFFDRIHLGRPYCPRCSRGLHESFQEHWLDAYSRCFYECTECGTEIDTDHDMLTNDALGTVRRDYLSFWSRYQDEIRHLTGDKPRRWKVPP